MHPTRTGGAKSRINQVLNKAMSQNGLKMSLLETKQVPDEAIYRNAAGMMSTSGKIALEKKKEEIEEKQMKVFGVLMKHIEPNSRAWAILGDSGRFGKRVGPSCDIYQIKRNLRRRLNSWFFRDNGKVFRPSL